MSQFFFFFFPLFSLLQKLDCTLDTSLLHLQIIFYTVNKELNDYNFFLIVIDPINLNAKKKYKDNFFFFEIEEQFKNVNVGDDDDNIDLTYGDRSLLSKMINMMRNKYYFVFYMYYHF